MKKLFISADMEGVAGVSAPNGLAPERWGWEWAACRRWMTNEVVAVCEAALESGFESVIVADSHHNAHNIDPESLPDRVWLIRSWPRPLIHMQGADEPGVCAVAFIGYHGGSTDSKALMAHSFHGGAFREVRLNGNVCSEGYLNAAFAGEIGKPVVLVSGDGATIEDARSYAPLAIGHVTKKTIGWQCQMSLAPRHATSALKEAASKAFRIDSGQPFSIAGPYELELEMTRQTTAEMLAYLPYVRRLGAYSIAVEFKSIGDALRFISFAMLYTPTGPAL
jgi:D-amino peptidase